MPLVYSCDTVKSETLERSKTLSVSRSGLHMYHNFDMYLFVAA